MFHIPLNLLYFTSGGLILTFDITALIKEPPDLVCSSNCRLDRTVVCVHYGAEPSIRLELLLSVKAIRPNDGPRPATLALFHLYKNISLTLQMKSAPCNKMLKGRVLKPLRL